MLMESVLHRWVSGSAAWTGPGPSSIMPSVGTRPSMPGMQSRNIMVLRRLGRPRWPPIGVVFAADRCGSRRVGGHLGGHLAGCGQWGGLGILPSSSSVRRHAIDNPARIDDLRGKQGGRERGFQQSPDCGVHAPLLRLIRLECRGRRAVPATDSPCPIGPRSLTLSPLPLP